MKRFRAALGWVLVSVICAAASEIPDLVIPEGVGVNIHFVTGHEQDLDLIRAGGFKFIRMDFGWAGIERRKGEYDWSGYEELTRQLEARGMKAIYILDYSNPLYEQTVESKNPITGQAHRDLASPQHPGSVEAYARWAAAAAKHFHGRGIIWEFWNEPNITFWKPHPDAQQYTAMALAAARAIREAEPQATMAGPASSGFPWPFLEVFLGSGILDYLDGVSVHPYRNYSNPPESAASDYARLRAMIEAKARTAAQKKLPIISGEWGYASHSKGVSLEKQAEFAVRQQLSNLMEGVPVSIWYDWKNDGPDAGEREHNFGVVGADLEPKPAYRAVQQLTRSLNGFRYVERVGGSEEDFAVVFKNATGERKLVAWTRGQEHGRVIVCSEEKSLPKEGVSLMGKPVSVVKKGAGVELTLDGAPRFYAIGEGRLSFQN